MDSARDTSAIGGWRYSIAVATVLLSLVVPAATTYCTFRVAFSGKPIGRPSSEAKIYQGQLKDGDLWFLSYQLFDDGSSYEVVIKRLNLQSGAESDTGFRFGKNEDGFPLWLNGELYGIGSFNIYRKESSTFTTLAKRPAPSSANFYSVPFIWDDRLTMIEETSEGQFRLIHLMNGEWQQGREILLPRMDWQWTEDPHSGHETLQPPGSAQRSVTPVTQMIVFVIPRTNGPVVYVTDYASLSVVRNGFQFVDERQETPSALRPENLALRVSGWQPVNPNAPGESWKMVTASRDGLLFAGTTNQRLGRRNDDGSWIDIPHGGRLAFHNPVIISNDSEESEYVICEIQHWNAATIHRIRDNEVQPAHLSLSGSMPEYTRRWVAVTGGILSTWAIHSLVILAGTAIAARLANQSTYVSGIERATLASVASRAFASGIDLMICVAAVLLVVVFESHDVPVNYLMSPLAREIDFSNSLESLETAIRDSQLVPFDQLWRSFLRYIGGRRLLTPVPVLTALAFFGIKALIESRWGITPGKWLMGIRTVRSTLRPVGFGRILVRDVLYCVDIPLLLTPIPAALSIMLSHCRQRLGDRVADTVVIQRPKDGASLRE